VSNALIEHHQREDGGAWRYRVVGEGGRITLKSGARLDVDTIHRGVFELEGD
jgi:hypothetical protein